MAPTRVKSFIHATNKLIKPPITAVHTTVRINFFQHTISPLNNKRQINFKIILVLVTMAAPV